jgi:hypothetical protein
MAAAEWIGGGGRSDLAERLGFGARGEHGGDEPSRTARDSAR